MVCTHTTGCPVCDFLTKPSGAALESAVFCPICDASPVNITSTYSERTYTAAYGDPIPFRFRNDHCNVCGEDGDFTAANDPHIESARERSRATSVPKMIELLAAHGYTSAATERILGIPFGTIERWRCEGCDQVGVALLRLLAATCTPTANPLEIVNDRIGDIP